MVYILHRDGGGTARPHFRREPLITRLPGGLHAGATPHEVLAHVDRGVAPDDFRNLSFHNKLFLKAGYNLDQVNFLTKEFRVFYKKFPDDLPLVDSRDIGVEIENIIDRFSHRYNINYFSLEQAQAIAYLASIRLFGQYEDRPSKAPGEILNPFAWEEGRVETFPEGFKFDIDQLKPLREKLNTVIEENSRFGISVNALKSIIHYAFKESDASEKGKAPLGRALAGEILMGTFHFPREYRKDDSVRGMPQDLLVPYIPLGVLDVSHDTSRYSHSSWYKDFKEQLDVARIGIYFDSTEMTSEVMGREICSVFLRLKGKKVSHEDAMAMILFISEKLFPRTLYSGSKKNHPIDEISMISDRGQCFIHPKKGQISPEDMRLIYSVTQATLKDNPLSVDKLSSFLENLFKHDVVHGRYGAITKFRAASVLTLIATSLDPSKRVQFSILESESCKS